MWFWDTLVEYALALLALFAVCAVAGVIGFQIRKGLLHARMKNVKQAILRIGYGVIGCAAMITGLALFHATLIAWVIVAVPALGGFFGYFIVPGEE